MGKKKIRPMEWKTFEDVVRFIVNEHKDFFGLSRVDPTPKKVKARAGNTWNIEIVGYLKGSDLTTLFEVRRKKKNLTPEEAGGFAYRIDGTGSEKGFFVTRLDRGLSKSARKIADYEEIGHISVSANAKPNAYVMKFLNSFFAQFTDGVGVADRVEIKCVGSDGKTKQHSKLGS